MPTPELMLLFVASTLALAFTPGPDMLYIAARSASGGRAAGVASVLGVSVGLVVHTVALALGLSALLAAVPAAYAAVRYLGAAYLVYLGVRFLLGAPAAASPDRERETRPGAVFAQGLLTNLLNPKVALFFLAFIPQFVDPTRGPVVVQLLLLGFLFNALGSLVNLLVALLASRSTEWVRSRSRPALALRRVAGCLLVGLGARLALSDG